MRRRWVVVIGSFPIVLVGLSLGVRSEGAPAIDLPKLIECRAEMADYTQLATKIGADGDGSPLGWTKIKQPNGFIAEYQLPKPIVVFGGYKTRRIAFSASGILAILEHGQVKPEALATKLHLEPVQVGGNRLIYAKVVKNDTDDVASIVIRLNVSTLDSHSGKTFAGCEYQLTVK
jgi:hypothetical protein